MKKRIVVIYHKADFDGIFCREIAKKFLPDATLIGWDYGDPIPTPEVVSEHDDLYMLDISVEGLMEHPRLIWIDHHKSAIEKFGAQSDWIYEPAGKDSFGVFYKEFWRRGHETRTTAPISSEIDGYRIDGVAACRLAWQWFSHITKPDGKSILGHQSKSDFIDHRVEEPYAVRLAGEYDIWDKRDPDAELFQHGLRSRELTDAVWECLLVNEQHEGGKDDIGTVMVEALLEAGKALQYAKTRENESIIKSAGFTVQFEGLTFLACNHARYNSFLFTAGLKPEHDACLGFAWRDNKWTVSLYHAPGKEHHDLSLIAVKHGGGGHRGACGFQTKTLSLLPA